MPQTKTLSKSAKKPISEGAVIRVLYMSLIILQQSQSSILTAIEHNILPSQTRLPFEFGRCEATHTTLDSCLNEPKLRGSRHGRDNGVDAHESVLQ
jgi:hypothetical protein